MAHTTLVSLISLVLRAPIPSPLGVTSHPLSQAPAVQRDTLCASCLALVQLVTLCVCVCTRVRVCVCLLVLSPCAVHSVASLPSSAFLLVSDNLSFNVLPAGLLHLQPSSCG